MYIDVVIPLAVYSTYTYKVPRELEDDLQFGVRVEVPFGKKKLYAGLVIEIHKTPPSYATREVISVLDEESIITRPQLEFWQWIARYYFCGLGEVMHAAVPSRLKLNSETIILPGPMLDEKIFDLDDRSYMIAEAVQIQKELTIDKIRSILEIKTVYPLIKRLLEEEVIEVKEELQGGFKAKKLVAIRLTRDSSDAQVRQEMFDLVARSDHQTRALLTIFQLQRDMKVITQEHLVRVAEVSHQVLVALEKKGVIERFETTVSRLGSYDEALDTEQPLSDQQEVAVKAIHAGREQQKPVLLHGVTGSGKTRVYVELIREVLAQGRQVLYLLPEIALTTQIVGRLKRIFGDQLLVYHSRINEHKRVEVWRKVLGTPKVVLGARSSILLPFADLGLVIVDEEHDGSYKQTEPNPRYQGRDAAIYLSGRHEALCILGTGTPSLESYYNARQGKYQLVEMPERFGQMPLPEVVLVDMKRQGANNHFSKILLDEMEEVHKKGFQTILFRNRRGFAPVMTCSNCGWTALCTNCDTSLTYHQYRNEMQCHLCGYTEKTALVCPACGNHELVLKGFGTELLEDELKIRWPEMKIGRLDLDTARGKKNLEKILEKFESRNLDILIGTQMVTKGLDFDHVSLVGIISADHLLHYPDFRATERAFQLMEQVSGRAGRKHHKGRVVIQAYQISHPVIRDVLDHDYQRFFAREIQERKTFGFPPFSRMIEITVRHTDAKKSDAAARFLYKYLADRLGDRVKGPIVPSIPRVRNRYIQHIVLKLEKKAKLIRDAKCWIKESVDYLKKQKGLTTIRVSVNVDP